MEILKEMPRRYPFNGTFELTVRCNLKCKMCLFRHDDSESSEIMAKEKTAEEWIDMARQVAEAGTLHILITGGEPMLRPDFCEIYEGIYKQGFMITLYTNATLVTSKIMETLRKYPPHKIGITLYGSNEEVYQKVCGNGEIFNNVISGIKQLSNLPSIIEFRTTIIKDNVNDLYNMEELIKDLSGEDCRLIHSEEVHKAVRGGCSDVESCRLSPKENVDFLLQRYEDSIKAFAKQNGLLDSELTISRKKINKNMNNLNKKVSSSHKLGDMRLFDCDAGMESYAISYDGKLLGCQLLGNFYTDPFSIGFDMAWNKYPFVVDLPERNPKCDKCEIVSYCKSCVAVRYAETNHLNGCPKYIYEEVKELLNKCL